MVEIRFSVRRPGSGEFSGCLKIGAGLIGALIFLGRLSYTPGGMPKDHRDKLKDTSLAFDARESANPTLPTSHDCANFTYPARPAVPPPSG
jgi:hypothetical protein